jgi:hypothetical protein
MRLFIALAAVWIVLGSRIAATSVALGAPVEIDAQRISGNQSYPDLSIAQQEKILAYLGKFSFGALSAYYVPKDDPVLRWVHPGLLERFYRMNKPRSESNCYWTSMFALGVVGLPERFMGLEEYFSLLAERFTALDQNDEFAPGDVIRLRRVRGKMDTHSVVYLGRLKGSDYLDLVISKNGPEDGPYLIMNLSELQNRFYPGSAIAGVFRHK